jgi:hypothetical protein
MSLGNWGESLLRSAAGEFFGSEYLRDYTHASKTFRPNSYENSPKFKFLFHTYFDINPEAYPQATNFGILVKEVRLPSYSLQTAQMNQYNRKRIVQTKIRYEPIDITFHDDNGNNVTKMWEAYYRYYYNDGSKPGAVLPAERGSPIERTQFFDGEITESIENYNYRDIYEKAENKNYDWGFSGGNNANFADSGVKVPFFRNITVFGLHQHNFTAYTLVNPVITNFSHDTYNYDTGNGVMENKMTIDYETVVYNYGSLDGRDPASIVTGFGSEQNYDRTPSPIMSPGANGTVLGQGGLIDAAGGFIQSLKDGNAAGAVLNANAVYNGLKNPNLKETAAIELTNSFLTSLTNTPKNRNAPFSVPGANQTPGVVGLAGFPTIGAKRSPAPITNEPLAGEQYNGEDFSDVAGFPTEPIFGTGPITNT